MFIKPYLITATNDQGEAGAKYTFKTSASQDAFITEQYKKQTNKKARIRLEGFYSPNALNDQYIKINIPTSTGSYDVQVDLYGSCYSMSQFKAFLFPALQAKIRVYDTNATVSCDQNLLSFSNVFNMILTNITTIGTCIFTFHGYQTCIMLGLDMDMYGVSNDHEIIIQAPYDVNRYYIEAHSSYFCPVVKTMAIETNLQRNLTMCDDSKYRGIIGEYVSTVLVGDFFSVENYIDISEIDISQLAVNFWFKILDQRWHEVAQIDELRLYIQFVDEAEAKSGINRRPRLFNSRGV